ncbi:MAG TPA: dihydrolipoamide acetyltransferase family protein [Holophagaceae bacterium]|nr:dihydrolipoamide acetyltransferase family protein [Holophagaceae bacterium]
MAFDVIMPQMGESIAEATVLKWLKAPGDTIAKDETLYEISTDKVDAEIPAPAAGVLLEILVEVNKTVPVGSIVARIGAAGEKPAGGAAPAAAPAAGAATVPVTAAEAKLATPVHPMADEDDNSEEARLRSKSSPLVREMAKQHGIDLRQVKGTGEQGRVTKADMEAFIASGAKAPAAPAPMSGAMPMMASAHDPSAPTMGVVPGLAVPPAPAQPAFAPGERVKIEPMSRMRKIIADNMVNSKLRTSPHVYTIFEIDMSNVARLRAKHRKAFEEMYGTKLSFMPFIMKAVIKGLQAFPIVNSSVDGDNIIYKQDINLGIAVSLDWGLIVPVIKNADSLNIGGLARSLNDLAERARAKKLQPSEISGGTFTITNPGVFGDIFALPIISQPQVAIQAIGTIAKRPVVVTDELGNDAIAIRQIMFSGLSFDHRVIDGAVGDQFMSVVKNELEKGTFGLE